MLIDGLKPNPECECRKSELTLKLLLLQSLATSIDAFAVGIGFSAAGVRILPAACVIALTTFVISSLARLVGCRASRALKCPPELIGGILLVFIAIKALFD